MFKLYKLSLILVFSLAIQSLFAQVSPNLEVIVTAPANLAGKYNAISGGFGKALSASDPAISGKLVVVNAPLSNPTYLGCDSLSNGADVIGNIALISRGSCEFGVKCLNAEKAGAKAAVVFNNASGGPIVMGAGAVGASVTIPVCMISLEDGTKILDAIKAGTQVELTFRVPPFYNAFGPHTYSTPLSMVQPQADIQCNWINLSPNTATNVKFDAVVGEPDGNKVKLTTTLNEVPSLEDTVVVFEDYAPTKKGKYTLTFTNSVTPTDTLKLDYEVSDFKFALDNEPSYDVSTAAGWVTVSASAFATAGGRYDMGATYLAGPNPGKVTHVAFALNNLDSYPEGEAFDIFLYELTEDPDANGSASSYDDFTLLGVAQYQKSANDAGQKIITIKLGDTNGNAAPIPLQADRQYLVVVKYENSGNTDNPPKFIYNTQKTFAYSNETVWTDSLYMGGWAGEYNVLIRLYTDAYVSNKNLPYLNDNSLLLSPNPANEMLKVNFKFEKGLNDVKTYIVDLDGKLIGSQSFDKVSNNDETTINVTNLPSGTYFYTIESKEGWTTKSFIVKH